MPDLVSSVCSVEEFYLYFCHEWPRYEMNLSSNSFQLNDDAWPNIFPISLEALIEIWARSSGGFARGLVEVSGAADEICKFIPLTSTWVPPSKQLLLQHIANLATIFKTECFCLFSQEVKCSTMHNVLYRVLEMY